MIGFFRKLFSTDFTPHGYCIRIPEVIWLHEVSDLIIAFSYFLIPLALIYLVRIRRDLVYPWLFSLFGLFIISCGATHLLSVYVLWHPMYRLEGLVKGITAIASLPTALLLFRVLPEAKRLPSAQLLRHQNAALGAEISERKRGEEKIRELNELLQRQFSGVNQLLDAVLEALPVSIIIVNSEGRLVRMNRASERIWGDVLPVSQQTPGEKEWVGYCSDSGNRIPPDEWVLSRAIRNGETTTEERIEIERSGEHGRATLEISAAPVRDAAGNIIAGVVASVDVTERVRAEHAVRSSEATLNAVLDALPLAVVISDPGGSLIRENHAHRELWGVAPELPSWEQIPEWVGFWPETGARIEGHEWAISRALLKGEAVRGEVVEIERPGSHERRFVLHNAAPVRDGQGRIMAGVLAATDITEQRRTEEAIRENDATIRALLETASQAIIGVDPKGFIRIVNKMAEQAFGYTRAELIGHPLENLLPEHFRKNHSGYRAQYTAAPRQRRMGEHQALVGQRKDGSRFPVEISLSYVDTREGVLSVAFITDTTERDQAAQALRDSEARFRQLADSMPQMVWTARPDGYVDYYNERWYEFTGFNRSNKGDESWIPIVHPDDLPVIRDVWSASLADGNMYELEYRYWDRMAKRWRWFIGRALPVRNRSGEIVKWFGTSTDIDVQKRVEDELRRANQDLEQFAYSASHDLKEPLRNLVIYSEMLRKRYGNQFDTEGEEFLQHVSEGARRISGLVADLLAYTEAATLSTEVEPVNCAEILQEVVRDLEPEITQSSGRIIESGLPTVSANAVHVRQLFQNLISNALKYRSESEPPTVTVTARRENSFWHFLVRDNGIGIEPQYHKQIFGLFKRLHGRYGSYSGSGIGLAICQKIVERYGGRIWVESELGGGATFHFLLPGLPDQHER
jgi:PAS domain S-box-containing protein